ncbi:hypothetical protein [Gimesia alba]|uniref:hypothetical protein n=1 Tax=Gimesia alba TaxID=2527973 RepID=UPI0011AAF931|nr:hypothetical protein [Gimesia alba]
MTTTDEECRKDMENYFIAPLCGLFLGLIAETFICSWSWLETGPMIRFSNGVRLPFIGPLLGVVLLSLVSSRFGQIKLTGWFKHLIVGGIIGLITGYVIGVWIISPVLASQHGIFAGKALAAHSRFFIIIGMPVSGLIGGLCGIGYSVIRGNKKTHA